jgi:hypothetical protein
VRNTFDYLLVPKTGIYRQMCIKKLLIWDCVKVHAAVLSCHRKTTGLTEGETGVAKLVGGFMQIFFTNVQKNCILWWGCEVQHCYFSSVDSANSRMWSITPCCHIRDAAQMFVKRLPFAKIWLLQSHDIWRFVLFWRCVIYSPVQEFVHIFRGTGSI